MSFYLYRNRNDRGNNRIIVAVGQKKVHAWLWDDKKGVIIRIIVPVKCKFNDDHYNNSLCG